MGKVLPSFTELVYETSLRPVAYVGQRYASSSYEQWCKIEQSYGSFWKAFEALYPNRNEEEELQYMIAGSDFVVDLLACLDIMGPVNDEEKRVTGGRFTWKLREESDIKEDHKRVASDLMNPLDRRVQSAVSDHSLTVVQAFDAAGLARLQSGALSADGVVKLEIEHGEYDTYGVRACEAVFPVASNMELIQKWGMDQDPRLAFRYLDRIKEAVKMKFASGQEYSVRLHEQNVFSSCYSQEGIYSIAQPQSHTTLDIVLAKGEPEAIAESYYSCMRAQQKVWKPIK
ncbi:hypothetical protein AWC38_SpisGene5510 [Stylophora pistillata]|uniref:Uncharacterized protein n=1 Tax=Stylophora pistillata TaxID=50429 RepID=A0A2B4SMH0_STYPI|nr:hypothetical protein AWC38_SpisGene5510 [Stylophora pistillata]